MRWVDTSQPYVIEVTGRVRHVVSVSCLSELSLVRLGLRILMVFLVFQKVQRAALDPVS